MFMPMYAGLESEPEHLKPSLCSHSCTHLSTQLKISQHLLLHASQPLSLSITNVLSA